MERDGIATAAYVVALVLGIGYAAAGVIGWLVDVADGSDLAFWLLLLLGGALLIFAGLFLTRRWSWPSVLLLSLGALVGAIALFWSVVAPILALLLIVLAVLATRRSAATA